MLLASIFFLHHHKSITLCVYKYTYSQSLNGRYIFKWFWHPIQSLSHVCALIYVVVSAMCCVFVSHCEKSKKLFGCEVKQKLERVRKKERLGLKKQKKHNSSQDHVCRLQATGTTHQKNNSETHISTSTLIHTYIQAR